jgi:hypothetical protein
VSGGCGCDWVMVEEGAWCSGCLRRWCNDSPTSFGMEQLMVDGCFSVFLLIHYDLCNQLKGEERKRRECKIKL